MDAFLNYPNLFDVYNGEENCMIPSCHIRFKCFLLLVLQEKHIGTAFPRVQLILVLPGERQVQTYLKMKINSKPKITQVFTNSKEKACFELGFRLVPISFQSFHSSLMFFSVLFYLRWNTTIFNSCWPPAMHTMNEWRKRRSCFYSTSEWKQMSKPYIFFTKW